VAVELRQFVEEQHAVMRKRDLARSRLRAAADQRDSGCGVVRRPERTQLPRGDIEAVSRHRAHRGEFERLGFLERRQDAGETTRQHRLAGAGRSDQQKVVRTRRGDFECTPCLLLAAHVGEVRRMRDGLFALRCRLGARQFATTGEVCANRQQRIGDERVGSARQRGLGAVAARHDGAPAGAHRAQDRGQCAVHRAQLAGERQLADEFILSQRCARNAAVGGENAERDRQIEAAAVLGQIGRCEVHGDPALGVFELRVEDRRAHAIARFLYRRFRQSDDRGTGQAAGKMHFAGDQRRGHAILRTAVDDGETHAEMYEKSPAAPPGVSSGSSRRPG